MKPIFPWLSLILTLPATAGPGPLKVSTVLSPRPYFVGQGIELRVEVDAGAADLSMELPSIPGAEVYAWPIDPATTTSRRFVIVPSRVGTIDLPSIRVRSGDRSGLSKPARLQAANVPSDGRTSAFLGGVGTFQVQAEASILTPKVGDTFEYRVRLSGVAAFGGVRAPDLSEWRSPTLQVESIDGPLQLAKTPSRTFRYRLRFLKAGTVTLPPVVVAGFDPATRRYSTRATSSLTVRVEELPRFDPARLDYGSGSPRARHGGLGPVKLAVGVGAIVLSLIFLTWLVVRRRRSSRVVSPRELALELAKGLRGGAEPDEVEAARSVADALTTYLHQVGGRERGVLTPAEARSGIKRLSADDALADWAEALMTRCDWSRYRADRRETRGLIEEGERFLESLAVSKSRLAKGPDGKPGEAVETTPAS